jgi:hypothetical protein
MIKVWEGIWKPSSARNYYKIEMDENGQVYVWGRRTNRPAEKWTVQKRELCGSNLRMSEWHGMTEYEKYKSLRLVVTDE